jgi:hypothetical protein
MTDKDHLDDAVEHLKAAEKSLLCIMDPYTRSPALHTTRLLIGDLSEKQIKMLTQEYRMHYAHND